MTSTPHTCLVCGGVYWTLAPGGYSVAFQAHIDSHDEREWPE